MEFKLSWKCSQRNNRLFDIIIGVAFVTYNIYACTTTCNITYYANNYIASIIFVVNIP